MTPSQIDKQREVFELFLSKHGRASNYLGDGEYAHPNQLAYEAFQAGYDAGLSAAVKVEMREYGPEVI